VPPRSSSDVSGRGRHHWWPAALGVVLVLVGLVAWLNQSPRPVTSNGAPGSSDGPSPAAATTRVAEAKRAPWVPGAPRRIVIPRLHVRAPVLPIRTQGDTLIPPSDPQELGWWAGGARPGAARGSVLVTGHTVHTGGGALDDLEQMRPGDPVVIRTDHGWIRYEVRRVHVYAKGSVAQHAPQLFSQQVPGRLVLVTCEDWNGERYLSNVVVTAAPVAGSR